MFARGQPDSEVGGLPAEVLPIQIEAAVLLLIVNPRQSFAVVDPQRQADRIGVRGALAAEEHPHHVLALDGDAVHGVERVGQAEARDVVLEREHAGVTVSPAIGSEAGERGLERRRTVDRGARDRVGGGQILLHQHRREREHVGDVVEPVAGVVLRKIVGGPEIDAEQLADGVVVFRAVQPPRRHTARIRRRDPIDARELALEPAGDALPLLLVRLVLFHRRHLAAPEHPDHVFPVVALIDQRVGRLERLKVQAVLRLPLVTVTGVAVLRQERLDGALEAFHARGVEDRNRSRPNWSWSAASRQYASGTHLSRVRNLPPAATPDGLAPARQKGSR